MFPPLTLHPTKNAAANHDQFQPSMLISPVTLFCILCMATRKYYEKRK